MTPQDLMEHAGDLGSPPDIISRMQRVLSHSRSSAKDIANAIQTDGPLSARVLKLSNSALFGLSNEVDSIDRAVTVIGTRQIHSLAMAASILDKFQGLDTGSFNAEVFWRHSLAVAFAARAIGQKVKDENPEQLFLCGVIHDLGRLTMLVAAPAEMVRALNRSQERKEPLLMSEQAVFGWDHTQAAKTLLESWKFPSSVVQPVVRHHLPGGDRPSCIMHIADALVHGLAIGSSGESHIPPLQDTAWGLAGMKPKIIKELVTSIDRGYPELEEMLLGKTPEAAV